MPKRGTHSMQNLERVGVVTIGRDNSTRLTAIGRMMRDEIETVLKLPEILSRRVVGQSHGLTMIAKRIETSRAKLDNPSKPRATGDRSR